MAWRPFRNLGLKAMAVGLGTLLWFTVTGEQVERKVQRVPIFYRGLPGSLEITDQPDSVDVSVRGSYTEISRMQDLAITANLSSGVPGANVLPLRVDMVNAPLGVEVTGIDPGTVTVYLERSGMADVPVRPTIEGQPALGFAITRVEVDPRMVVVVGPESRLRPTTAAVTERVSIQGLRESTTAAVSVGVTDAQLRLAQPRTARVTVRIEPVAIELSADMRQIEWRGLASGLWAESDLEAATVTVRATGRAAELFKPSDVRPWVDLAGRKPGQHRLQVEVAVGDGIEVVSVVPATVNVRIR